MGADVTGQGLAQIGEKRELRHPAGAEALDASRCRTVHGLFSQAENSAFIQILYDVQAAAVGEIPSQIDGFIVRMVETVRMIMQDWQIDKDRQTEETMQHQSVPFGAAKNRKGG